jgi:purine-cytosine permease-like protein
VLELNGINIISESERHGKPNILFWPWMAGNVSLLALSYGSFFLGYGISFWQATAAAILGTIGSFTLVAISSLAGKKSNAPTMTLSRAIFGVKGNIVPGFLSYLIFVGWETVLVSLATLATGTVFTEFGHINKNLAEVIGFTFAAGLTIISGVLGFKLIMKIQRWVTIATLVLSIGYVFLTLNKINWSAVKTIPNGNSTGFLGALIFGVIGIGLGWVNSAADYSRYLPRSSSSRAVVGWTIFGASIVPILMVIYGSLLAASSRTLNDAIAADPIGALTTLLPKWYLIPFALVAILGLIGGSILDLYSSGIALVSIGLPVKRHIAAAIDGGIMTVGTIYIVWIADNFIGPFQSFLITLGVPVAVWSAMFVADVISRKGYNEAALFDKSGEYGSWNFKSLALLISGSIVGWSFVSKTIGNIGIIYALVIGFVGQLVLAKKKPRK